MVGMAFVDILYTKAAHNEDKDDRVAAVLLEARGGGIFVGAMINKACR